MSSRPIKRGLHSMAGPRNLSMVLGGLTSVPMVAVKSAPAGTLALDNFLTRFEAVALLQKLNGELLASHSATVTLERWCEEYGRAGVAEAKIIARPTTIGPKTPTADQRHRLEVGSETELKYRHVQLVCGDRVLSEADNWYVPSRLPAEMNRLLETT